MLKITLNKISEQVNYNHLENDYNYHIIWGKLLSLDNYLSMPLLNYQITHTIPFFEKIKIDGIMNSLKSRIFNLSEIHRTKILPIKIAIIEYNSHFYPNKPILEELNNDKKENMSIIIDEINKILNDVTYIHTQLNNLYPKYVKNHRDSIFKKCTISAKKKEKI